MYNTSVSYRDRIQSLTRVFTLDIKVEYEDELGVKRTINIDDEDISTGSFVHEEASQSSDEFTVGGIYGSNIRFTLVNDDKFEGIDFIDAKITPTVGLLMGDNIVQYENWMDLNNYTWETMTSRAWGELTKEIEGDKDIIEYVPLGVFNVDTVDEHRTTTEIRAIDDMIKLDKPYDLSNQVYPASLKQIYLNLCNVGEVSYKTMDFPNGSYVVQKRPEGEYSLRDILSFVAEASGTFAQFNRLGSLELKWYDEDSITMTPDNRSNFVAKKYEVQISGVSKTIKGDSEENDTVYLSGEEGYVIDLSDNPLIQDGFQTVLQTIFNEIKDTKFTPYEATWQGNPAIQAGDKITHVSVGRELENGIIEDGEVYESIITNSTYVYRGAGEISAKGLPEISRDYSGSIVNKIRRQINVEIGKEVSRLDVEREKAGQLIANMMGGHLIVEYDALYIANAPTLKDATKVWKWGIGGFGYFPEGIYDENGNVNDPLTGVTAEGSIVAELVAAGIVSADYVETGILSSFGGETWINLDNGHFKLGGLIQDDNGFRIEYGGTNLEDELDGIKDSIKDNEPTYVWIKYSNEFDGGNPDGSEMFDNGAGMDYIGIANNKGSSIPSIVPSDYMWSKFKGEDGEGKGISSITEWYLATDLSTGINIQTVGWDTNIVGYGEDKQYLWNYEVIKYTDNTEQTTLPRIIGVWGKDGTGIESLTEYYLASPLSYGIKNTSHGFSEFPQPIDEVNPYLWNYEKIVYTNGDIHNTDAVIVGVFGKDGKDGEDGYNGEDTLVGILSSDSHVIPADPNGFVSSEGLRGAETKFEIYQGLLNETEKWTFRVHSTDGVIGNLIGNKYVVNNLIQDRGKVTLVASRNMYPDITKVFSLSKAKTGMYSTRYWMVLDSKVIKEDSMGRYSPESITITSMKQLGDNPPEEHPCLFWIGETANVNDTPTRKYQTPFGEEESQLTYTPTKGIISIKIQTHNDNYINITDSETVVVLRDGEDGNDGYTPIKGTDYFDGEDGQTGDSYIPWVRYSKYKDGGASLGSEDGEYFYIDPNDVPLGEGDSVYIGIATSKNGIAPMNPNSYTWSKFTSKDGIDGEKGEDGRTPKMHIKYSNDGGVTFTDNDGEDVGPWMGVYVDYNEKDSMNPLMYTWNRTRGEDGSDGIDGEDGTSEYIWIMYSDVWNGLFMSPDPTDKTFMGIAHTNTPYRPSDRDDYVWSRFVAEDGVPGDDGISTHVKYSDDGVKFTLNPSTNIRDGETFGDWIGIYRDRKTEDSMVFNKYSWRNMKGVKGDPGTDGITVLEVDVEYRLSDSRSTLTSNYSWKTTLTAAEFAQGKFIWSRTKTTYSRGSPTYSSASLISGNSGTDGTDGRGVTRIEEQYYLSLYSNRLYDGYWSSTPPPWRAGRYMWTRSRIYYSDGTSNTTNEEVDRAWETINGIDDKVVSVNQRVDSLNGIVSSKISIGDLGSEFYQSAGEIKLNAKNIYLKGAVSVLSDIAGNLGSITAGRIDGVTLTGGTIEIGVNAFEVTSNGTLYAGRRGFMVPPDADGITNNFGNSENIYAARWKHTDRNYIYQDLNEFRIYIRGGAYYQYRQDPDNHWLMQIGGRDRGSVIKSLSGTRRAVQFRNGRDNGYISIDILGLNTTGNIQCDGVVRAQDFINTSSKSLKKDIVPTKSKLDIVKNTPVFDFKFIEDVRQKAHTGFIVEESPSVITTKLSSKSKEDDGISIMDTVATLWKAVQELSNKVEELERG